MYKERTEAAKQLSRELYKYEKEECVILAIHKGGFPIASVIAEELHKPHEVYLTGKISHPDNKNLKIGTVDLAGKIINADIEEATESYLEQEIGIIRNELQRKYYEFMGTEIPLTLKNKTVILVDDGVENGEEMIATVELLKKNKPGKVVLAVPVATETFKNNIKDLVDDFICLETQPDIEGVKMVKDQYEELEMERYIPVGRAVEQRRN